MAIIEKIKDSYAEAGNPMLGYTVKNEDIMVAFKGLMTSATHVAVQNIENLIPMQIIKIIKNNPVLSQSRIAEMFWEDTI